MALDIIMKMLRVIKSRRAAFLIAVAAFGFCVLMAQRYILHKLLVVTSHSPSKSDARQLTHHGSVRKDYDSPLKYVTAFHHAATRNQSTSVGTHAATENSQGTDKYESKMIIMNLFPSYYELKEGTEVFDTCQYPCSLSLDVKMTSHADCVVFFTHNFPARSPPPRKNGSVWVYFAVESPVHSNNEVFAQPAWHKQFNWTMTYRKDSDIYFGYGAMVQQASYPQDKDLLATVKGKTKMAAWFVSNCQTQSKREHFVAALKGFITVDVYGQCGDLECGKEGKSCTDMLSHDYFFYIAFENSFCVDYMTEKLYHTMKMADVVPIVRGGAAYSSLLPTDSYIDVTDFPSVEALAEYLKLLAGDPSVYANFLEWRKEWSVTEPMPLPFCDLCHHVHTQQKSVRVYDDVDSWWRSGMCHEPPPLVV